MVQENQKIVVTEYICKECGSHLCTLSNQKDICAICGGHSFKVEEYTETRTMLLVPFSKTINDARRNYRRKVLWNPLLPLSFKTRKKYQSIQKVFLPAFLVNANHSGQIVILGGEKGKVVKNRSKLRELKKYDVCQSINLDYKNVLLNASSKVKNLYFDNICNYNFKNIRNFTSHDITDASYLLGNVSTEEIGKKGRKKIFDYSLLLAEQRVKHPMKRLKEDNSVVKFYDSKEILIPVYLLSVEYKNHIYQYFMNGSNGKSYMELPISIVSTCIFIIITFSFFFFIIVCLLT